VSEIIFWSRTAVRSKLVHFCNISSFSTASGAFDTKKWTLEIKSLFTESSVETMTIIDRSVKMVMKTMNRSFSLKNIELRNSLPSK
jgi:hypothetical protein